MTSQKTDHSGSAPTWRFLWSHPAHTFALGFGSGLSPIAPGTAGTLAALPLWLLLQDCSFVLQSAVVLLSFFLGIYFCHKAADDLGVHDHGAIVWDEFVGLWLVLLFVPADGYWWLASFFLFRFFDIAKPWPISHFDRRVGGGFGIMLDDIIAAIFSLAVVFFLAAIL